MAQYTIKEICDIVKGTLITKQNGNDVVKHLLIDSRKITIPETSLFFALVSQRNNGHKYIAEIYRNGVKNFIVSETPQNPEQFPKANFVVVKDTLEALQQLATYHRKKFSIPVIGITGSNGKTIVKEWLYQLLSPDKNIIRSPKSYNSQIGVPLSIWQIEKEHEMAIIEAGISQPEEMKKLQPIIQPTIGIFTNIGSAHEKNFINNLHKAGEKLTLFSKTDTLIYCSDYFEIQDRIIKSEIFKHKNFFTWSFKNSGNLTIKSLEKEQNKTKITAKYLSSDISIVIPFTDSASIENAIHCWALMLLLNYSNEIIAERMLTLSPVAMRLELKAGVNNCSIINDSYSSDLNSLAIALDFMSQQSQHKNKTVILSDILQSSLHDSELYEEVSRLLVSKGVTRFIGIGPALLKNEKKFPLEKHFFENTEDFLSKMSSNSFHNETILIKGARIFEFEHISRMLQQKAHETVLEINLNALVHNLNYYRSLLKKETKIMAMVKAFSYGSGGYEIANVLQYHNIDYLAVAYADEGVELRRANIKTPIMVMNPEEETFDLMNKYQLEPEIYNFRTLKMLIATLKYYHSETIQKQPIHIKIDTGMHRLGFLPEEIDKLIEILKDNKHIEIRSVFTHLAASEDPEHDDFTLKQIQILKDTTEKIKKKLSVSPMIHVLNSAGIKRFQEFQFDMVRLGIGLYGISYDNAEQQNLQNVSSLKTSISQIKTVKKGETVGYGRKWKAPKDTKIAIIPVGYADGLNRKLANNKGFVYIGNTQAPIIGNICMDMCAIDTSETSAKEGDVVYIFKDAESIKELARKLDTIPYEILTSVSCRVKRIYYYE